MNELHGHVKAWALPRALVCGIMGIHGVAPAGCGLEDDDADSGGVEPIQSLLRHRNDRDRRGSLQRNKSAASGEGDQSLRKRATYAEAMVTIWRRLIMKHGQVEDIKQEREGRAKQR